MRLILAAASAALLTMAVQAHAAPPPASAFGRVPAVASASISPDGRRIAVLGGSSDQRFISIATVDDPALPILPLGAANAIDLTWVGNDHVLARIAYWHDSGVDLPYRFERNVSITPQAKIVARLLEDEDISQHSLRQPIIGFIDGPPARAVVRGLQNGGNQGHVMALWSVDPATGKGVMIDRGDASTIGWDLSATGEPRVRLGYSGDKFFLAKRGTGAALWPRFWTTESKNRHHYLGYSSPEDAVYLIDDGQVVRKRVSDGSTEVVSRPPSDTTPQMTWDSYRAAPLAIVTESENWDYQWLDPEIGNVHATVGKIFKDQYVDLMDWSTDRSRFLVRVYSRNSPSAWYLFDKARKEISPLGEEYPDLKGVALGQGAWIRYKARDGLDLRAYLTLPPKLAQGAKPPLIVLPDDGPGVDSRHDFNYLVHFLTSRGYAVLQPLYRGTWGFGQSFYDAGDGEWGGKMQTDLLDGVAAAGAQADTSRVCIIGGGFGGYAALAGVALHPEAYRCATSIAGYSDLGLLMVERRVWFGTESYAVEALRDRLGAAAKGKITAISPARQATKIRAPILLIHGENDSVVAPEQSKAMADAMKAAGKPVEYIVLKDENHDLTHAATRTQTLEALETFLAKHLPVMN